ncbi:hypothetical protein [Bradyrhizobium canariense]|nr:hypothetical protein [Bradyrhizobium canariense]
MKRFLRHRAVLAAVALVIVLGALLILSDDASLAHFNYKLF